MTDEKTNHALTESSLNVGLGLVDRIEKHLRQLAPHMMEREGVTLLQEARDKLREVALDELAAQAQEFGMGYEKPSVKVRG